MKRKLVISLCFAGLGFTTNTFAQGLPEACTQSPFQNQETSRSQSDGSWKWRPSSSESPSAVALVIHGLNNKPEKMLTLAGILNQRGIDTLVVSLSGHSGDIETFKHVTRERWLQDALGAYCEARKRADSLGVPLYLVAYSLGSAVTLDLQNSLENGSIRFDRMLLLAPAISVRTRSRAVTLLHSISTTLVIPSMSPADYRAASGTPVAAYDALFGSIDSVAQKGLSQSNVPTLVFIDPKDELVSSAGLQEVVSRNQLTNWKIIPVSTSESELTPSYHHLIIDSKAVGPKQWKSMEEEISALF